MDIPRQKGSISRCQPHSTTPHCSRDAIPTRLLGVPGCRPRLEARWRPFPRSPRSRSRVNLRVLRPLTRGPQGQPSPLRTPHGRPGIQGIFPTSRGQAPHGWPMVHHFMGTGFRNLRGCCLALSVPHPGPCPVPLCHIPSPAPSMRPEVSYPCGLSCGPISSLIPCLYPTRLPATLWRGPTGSSSIWGPFQAPSTGCSLPAPALFPFAASVTHLGLFPASCGFPVSLGRCLALGTRPSLSRPRFPASRVYTLPGRRQPFGAGPLDPHSSGDHFVCLTLVAPFPPPSAWVVCFLQDLWWVFLPGPRARRNPCLFPTWSFAVIVFYFRAPPAVSRLPVCSFRFPRRLLALCFTPSGGAVGFCF